MNILFLSNSFPEPGESYVSDQIRELTKQGASVTACGVLHDAKAGYAGLFSITLLPLHVTYCISATWLCFCRFKTIGDLVVRVLRGPEPFRRQLRTLGHTWLGAYLAARTRAFHLDHIHIHHGYFASWIGMVAARLLRIGYSMTLHGSDLLIRADYIDAKLQNCQFCFTVSEFNRLYIWDRYPEIKPSKVFVQQLGVDPQFWAPREITGPHVGFHIVSVGRLHAVKNQAFLLLACRALKSSGVQLRCTIVGEGEERPSLKQLVADLDLQGEVCLPGHITRDNLPDLYASADVVVLTSRSEGIPLTLMEAMAMERVVVAPDITGIPELISRGKTGFLYKAGSMEDLLIQLQRVLHGGRSLASIRRAARQQVLRSFSVQANLGRFSATFLANIGLHTPEHMVRPQQAHEDPLLQQI